MSNLAASLMKGFARKSVLGTYNTRTGWEARAGIPADSGDGFAYNREGWQLGFGSERAILQLDTAWACVKLLSQTIATLPVGIYKRLSDGGRKAVPDHRLYELLHNQPNPDMTAVDFWQVVVAWMLLRGTAYCELDKIGDEIVAIYPLYYPCLTWTKNSDGSRNYWYTDPFTGKQRQIAESNIWRLPAFTLDGKDGLSPIAYGCTAFGNALAADQASHNVFANGMSASGFLKYGKDTKDWLDKEKRTQIRQSINEFSGSSRAGKTMVLEGGMEYAQLSMNPEDAQMLETRGFSVEVICRWYGVPPTLVGHGDKTSNWGTGLEQQNLSFLTYQLRAWLSKIEQSVRKNLISQAEKSRIFAQFSVEGLLRADTAGRAAFYSSMTQNGIMTRDEARAKEDLPLMGGNAEELTVQTALTLLDKVGEKTVTSGNPPTVTDTGKV